MIKKMILFSIIVFLVGCSTNIESNKVTGNLILSNTDVNNNENGAANQNDDIYTMEEISKHNSINDCWTVVEGRVFDITEFIPRHSSKNIVRVCGYDGQMLIESQHGNSKYGILENYFIGTLK